MSRKLKILGAIAVVAVVTTPAGLAGQQPGNFAESAITAERSWAIQKRLADIEQNKEAAVKQLLESWAPFVDQSFYDPYSELHDIAMAAPAWQVFGASLAGDYKTMIDVLRGRSGAGKLVNTLSQPQAKQFASPLANLGETTSQLVFTPIPPCRIVDTRGSGARTGILAANTSRTFDLTTIGYGEGQGGQTSGCTGLPSFSHFGWAVNITVTDYSSNGGLQVYPFGGAIPATSIINYFPGAYALANNGHVTGCYGCADDITVRAFGAAANVIIDVMGYYQQATTTGLTASSVTRFAGTPVNINAGLEAFAYGGNCPAGTVMIGGENDFSGSDLAVGETRQNTATQWVMWQINNDGVTRTTTVYSRCLDTPVEQ